MLQPLLDQLLAAPPNDRPSLLEQLTLGDRARFDALRELLAECERPAPLFDRPVAERFPSLAAQEDDDLPPALLSGRYHVGRELGRGGMARVFLARDSKHEREVAVKVIRAELAASLGRDRFLREIAIAARLRHPNIVPLYDSGDSDGLLYFVMPYEEGPSLRARLNAGTLDIEEVIGILRDVARALTYAHERGVMHRDIKPDNVMMSGGAAVVADFGIAKAVSAAQEASTTGPLTQTGAGIGTPAYMSPEQAVGDPSSDHRSDIYSFGCLAYELLSSTPPFHGLPAHQVVAAHIRTLPEPIVTRRPDTPAKLSELVMRCLEKDPANRPQRASDLLGTLATTSTTGSAERVEAATIPQASTGSPTLARPARGLWKPAVAVALVGLLAVAGYLWRREEAANVPITLAVLPFGNTTGDNALAPVAAGLADQVFSALARVPGLQVRSRSGARAFIGQLATDPTEAGRRLHVDYLVSGVMREAEGRWIVSAELTRASDGTELWSQSFERTPQQQIGFADEIAKAATAALRARFPAALGVAASQSPGERTTNAEAYRLFLLGQELLPRRGQALRECTDAFRQAIRLDSTYGAAYAGLSLALSLAPYFQGIPPSTLFPELKDAADRALQIDSTLSQAHVALGLAYEQRFEWARAEVEFRTALRFASNDLEAHIQYGRFLNFLGRQPEALEQFQLARRDDPASSIVLAWVSYTYSLLGQQDSALAIGRLARPRSGGPPNFTTYSLESVVMVRNGMRDSAVAIARAVSGVDADAIYAQAAGGDTANAASKVRALELQQPPAALVNTTRAFYLLGVGDTARALHALEQATAAHEVWPAYIPTSSPMYDGVRESPHFAALLQQVGLSPNVALLTSPERTR